MKKRKKGLSRGRIHPASYRNFSRINGRHPLREAAPDGYVDYEARLRHGGEVFYFNFDLAEEMGLIKKGHLRELNPELSRTLLKTFSLQIINEYDVLNHIPVAERDKLPHKFMATRYLQLQHPDRYGFTSGDGRSIWNGCFRGRDAVWDIQSNGTGATCLSPATATENRFFRTGDPNASYGCGRADLLDGVCAAVMSEIFHQNGIPTERVLTLIRFKDGSSINVRAMQNLLRPAHIFRYLKQGNYDGLKSIVEYFIDRNVRNGKWPKKRSRKARYEEMLRKITIDFARAAAVFESEYIFCWLDWDGDNILTNAAILDYGSVRQFGLYHHEYRYDDVHTFSTNIREQKAKAKYIVQTFAQIADFLLTGKKKNIHRFRSHRTMKVFDREFERRKNERLLYKIGFLPAAVRKMMERPACVKELEKFRRIYEAFERVKSRRGLYKVEDGITWDAIFCLRDVLREIPPLYLQGYDPVPEDLFIDIMKSNYASTRDLKLNTYRKQQIRKFQRYYLKLVDRACRLTGKPRTRLLEEMTARSALINHDRRITGDSIVYVARRLIRARKKLNSRVIHKIIHNFVRAQVLTPEYFEWPAHLHQRLRNDKARNLFKSLLKSVEDHREGI